MKTNSILNIVSYIAMGITLIISFFFEEMIGTKASSILTYFQILFLAIVLVTEYVKRKRKI